MPAVDSPSDDAVLPTRSGVMSPDRDSTSVEAMTSLRVQMRRTHPGEQGTSCAMARVTKDHGQGGQTRGCRGRSRPGPVLSAEGLPSRDRRGARTRMQESLSLGCRNAPTVTMLV